LLGVRIRVILMVLIALLFTMPRYLIITSTWVNLFNPYNYPWESQNYCTDK
jgi:hypothetical protein